MAKITIKDIAREVGVSYETVSRALNRRGRVNPETATRIRDVAKRLNYTPNALARSLRVRNTATLGVIFPCIYENEFYAGIYRGLEDALLKNDYSIFLCNSDFDTDREAQNLRSLSSQRVDGIILGTAASGLDAYPNGELIMSIIDGGTPVILVDRSVPGIPTDVVASDHLDGGYAAVRHLLQLGHRRVGCVIGPEFSSVRLRYDGYLKAHHEAGIEVDPSLVHWFSHLPNADNDGYQAARMLLSLPPERRPTALFVVNDMTAINCIRGIQDLGLSVPGDVSVVGYDDLKVSVGLTVGLTTVRQDLRRIGREVGLLFLERSGQGTGEAPAYPAYVSVPNTLVVRDSTGPLSH